MDYFNIIFFSIIAYIIGSIPWGLLIGLVFFKKDIRKIGSGNIGGSNAGRALGKPIGILVILLDAFKSLIIIAISYNKLLHLAFIPGIFVCVGHCFSIFLNFKGGKAVSTAYGYILGVCIFINHEWLYQLVCPLLIFIFLLSIFKMVSLSSMLSLISYSIITLLYIDNNILKACSILLAILVIIRHASNIKKILLGTESKVTWI